jgi:hypothetical protein
VLPFGEPVRPAPARVRPQRPVAPPPLTWTVALVLAVLLAVATVAIAVAAVLGAFS